MPIFALQFLKDNFIAIGLAVALGIVSLDVAYKDQKIKSIELDLGQASLKIQMAEAAYQQRVEQIAQINKLNDANVALISNQYEQQLSDARKNHAQAYSTVIATVPAHVGVRLQPSNSAGDSAVPKDDPSASGTDEDTSGGEITLGDAIDCAIQVNGLQEYINQELSVLQ